MLKTWHTSPFESSITWPGRMMHGSVSSSHSSSSPGYTSSVMLGVEIEYSSSPQSRASPCSSLRTVATSSSGTSTLNVTSVIVFSLVEDAVHYSLSVDDRCWGCPEDAVVLHVHGRKTVDAVPTDAVAVPVVDGERVAEPAAGHPDVRVAPELALVVGHQTVCVPEEDVGAGVEQRSSGGIDASSSHVVRSSELADLDALLVRDDLPAALGQAEELIPGPVDAVEDGGLVGDEALQAGLVVALEIHAPAIETQRFVELIKRRVDTGYLT